MLQGETERYNAAGNNEAISCVKRMHIATIILLRWKLLKHKQSTSSCTFYPDLIQLYHEDKDRKDKCHEVRFHIVRWRWFGCWWWLRWSCVWLRRIAAWGRCRDRFLSWGDSWSVLIHRNGWPNHPVICLVTHSVLTHVISHLFSNSELIVV